jgi:hypothetical protein
MWCRGNRKFWKQSKKSTEFFLLSNERESRNIDGFGIDVTFRNFQFGSGSWRRQESQQNCKQGKKRTFKKKGVEYLKAGTYKRNRGLTVQRRYRDAQNLIGYDGCFRKKGCEKESQKMMTSVVVVVVVACCGGITRFR